MIDLDNNLNDIIKEGRTKEEYLLDYDSIINNAKHRGLDRSVLDGYYEIHHDIPRSIRPDLIKEDSNLTALTAKEHIVCHILLYRAYPENRKIIAAADCMLGCHLNCDSTREREEVIKNIDINLISELREKAPQLLAKSIVCYTKLENGSVIVNMEFNSISLAQKLSGYSGLSTAATQHIRRGKYFWEYKDSFIERFPKEYEDYLDRIDNGYVPTIDKWIPTVPDEFKEKKKLSNGKIVCISIKTDEVVRIYNRQSDATLDGFHLGAVSRSLYKKSGAGTRGFKFFFLSEAEADFPEKLEKFYNLSELPELTLRTTKVVCYDANSNRIYKIYDKQRDVGDDGFEYTSVCEVLRKSENKLYRGYRWEYLNNWSDKESLDQYNKRGPETPKPIRVSNDPQAIVKCDLEHNIVDIYPNQHAVPDMDYRLISKIVNDSISHRYKKGPYLWYKYEEFKEKYPKKLEEYDERNTNLNNTSE